MGFKVLESFGLYCDFGESQWDYNMMYQRQTEHLTRLIIANSEFLTMKFIRQGDMQNMAYVFLYRNSQTGVYHKIAVIKTLM